MKQLVQNLKTGETFFVESPTPTVGVNEVLVRTEYSLISTGTEKMLVDFGKANIFNKALQQPEKVAQVINKMKTDGVIETFHTVQSKLDDSIPLGYSNCGSVIAVGSGVHEFRVGDRVVSNGYHAEVVCVPKNLCVRVDPSVKSSEAVYTVLGSIALQALRTADCRLGEVVMVVGLGLVGLLCVQILRANGCRVIGVDPDERRRELAEEFGADQTFESLQDNLQPFVLQLTEQAGLDSILVAASSKSDSLLKESAQYLRRKGTLVLVGVCPIEFDRDVFFTKEICFQVSASYGPGRYDPTYEKDGIDYPVGYVRWTAKRNFEAVMSLMKSKSLDLVSLTSKTVSFEDALAEYSNLGALCNLGIVMTYKRDDERVFSSCVEIGHPERVIPSIRKYDLEKKVGLSLIGSGSYAKKVIAPNLPKNHCVLHAVASKQGLSATFLAKKIGFKKSVTNNEEVISHSETELVFIATPHNSHADLVGRCVDNKKAVFVEKPLCISRDELDFLKNKCGDQAFVMVGFNRRFSVFSRKIKELLSKENNPTIFVYTINAGQVSRDHWIQDSKVGGGRIIGEVCHFVDLLQFLSGSRMSLISASAIPDSDGVLANFRMANGSIAQLNYITNGHKSVPKERLQIFSAEKYLLLDNFKSLKGRGWSGFSSLRTFRQDKGQSACIRSCVESVIRGEKPSVSIEDAFWVSELCFDIRDRVSESDC